MDPTPVRPGRYGRFGGAYVPETLVPALDALGAAWADAQADPAFRAELDGLLAEYVGRPTPLTFAPRLSEEVGARVYLKREDLCHTGAHKINNALGQALLARRMGKTRVLAETGAGQHGVATAAVCARFGLPCVVYMGLEDVRRQRLNVERMRLLGAEVRAVDGGSATLKDATNEAIRSWVCDPEAYYLLGSAVGPHPYPALVRDLQRVIGDEVRAQLRVREGRDAPDALVACVGGGSNAIGLFAPFLADASVRMFAAEAAGEGLDGRHAATMARGAPGVLHGSLSLLLQDEAGQVQEAHSISAGLDYPGVGPEHASLHASGRVAYRPVTDAEALDGVRLLARTEGILPALESAHAIALLPAVARELGAGALVVLGLSGRGDKDMETLAARLA